MTCAMKADCEEVLLIRCSSTSLQMLSRSPMPSGIPLCASPDSSRAHVAILHHKCTRRSFKAKLRVAYLRSLSKGRTDFRSGSVAVLCSLGFIMAHNGRESLLGWSSHPFDFNLCMEPLMSIALQWVWASLRKSGDPDLL